MSLTEAEADGTPEAASVFAALGSPDPFRFLIIIIVIIFIAIIFREEGCNFKTMLSDDWPLLIFIVTITVPIWLARKVKK